uniref:Uncharacterized protein n=1 Tax=Melopsittacus undulatus TaxID=13146 RepID=A0A8V5G4Q3_MELUD
MSHGERACRLFFYPCLKQVEPKLYSKIRKYVSETNESIGDARRQLVGYLLEKDKVWFETKPRKDHTDVDIFDAVTKGNLSELEKTLKDNDINKLNPSSETLLHVAAANGHATVMEYLISKGAKVDVKDKNGRTPLHRAAEKGHVVEMLLNAKADPNAQDKEKKTPLHTAAVRGHLSIVEVLLAGKARFGIKDMDGCTPMHYAAIKGNIEIVKILLASGKNKNIDDRNIWRKTALHIAAEHGHSDLINVDLRAHPVPTPAMGRDTFHWSSLLQAPVSNLALNTARDGAATASLGTLCQRLSTLTGKKVIPNT